MLFSCRLLTSSDVGIFREMCLLAVQDVPEAFEETYEELSKVSPLDFEACFENGWIVGAFSSTTLLGIAGLVKHKGRKGMIWGLYVTPSFRGLGLGKKMIEVLLIKAKKSSIKRVFLRVAASNFYAILLYKKLGFSKCGLQKDSLTSGDLPSEELIMGRNI